MHLKVCVCTSLHAVTCLWMVHGNLGGVWSLLLPLEFWEIKSCRQAWQQVPFPTQPPLCCSVHFSLRTGNFHTAEIHFHPRFYFFGVILLHLTHHPSHPFYSLVNCGVFCVILDVSVRGGEKTLFHFTLSVQHQPCQSTSLGEHKLRCL